ncbi:hypothetical protein AGMMS49965_06930 [Bacteroidia bacterium]|nr:hypothetical protein AGMMS49965_06930 [Bacteroidia bacterium]
MKKIILYSTLTMFLLPSCAVRKVEQLKADVIGFSDGVQLSYENVLSSGSKEHNVPYNLLDPYQGRMMIDQVAILQKGINTAAYYAMDLGLDRVAEVQKKHMKKDPNSRYFVLFLTDGLDNNSLTLAKEKGRGRYANYDEYGAKLQNRMKSIMQNSILGIIPVKNETNSFQSYVMLFRDDDFSGDGYTTEEIRAKLPVFIGAQNAPKPHVLSGGSKESLIRQFTTAFAIAPFNFKINKDYANRRMRMKLDSLGTVWFDATLRTKKKSFGKETYYLEVIGASDNFGIGFDPNKGVKEVIGYTDEKDTKMALFSLKNLTLNGASYTINGEAEEKVTQWFYKEQQPYTEENLRQNTEYRPCPPLPHNTYILVILDTSASFGEKTKEAKETIIEIADHISGGQFKKLEL